MAHVRPFGLASACTKGAGKSAKQKKRPACSPGASLHDSEAKSGFLQVCSRLLAALRHNIVGDALAFVKGAHSRAFDRAEVHKHIARAVARSNERAGALCFALLDFFATFNLPNRINQNYAIRYHAVSRLS